MLSIFTLILNKANLIGYKINELMHFVFSYLNKNMRIKITLSTITEIY